MPLTEQDMKYLDSIVNSSEDKKQEDFDKLLAQPPDPKEEQFNKLLGEPATDSVGIVGKAVGAVDAAFHLAESGVAFSAGEAVKAWDLAANHIDKYILGNKHINPYKAAIDAGNHVAQQLTINPFTEKGKEYSELAMVPIVKTDEYMREGLRKAGVNEDIVDGFMEGVYMGMAWTGVRKGTSPFKKVHETMEKELGVKLPDDVKAQMDKSSIEKEIEVRHEKEKSGDPLTIHERLESIKEKFVKNIKEPLVDWATTNSTPHTERFSKVVGNFMATHAGSAEHALRDTKVWINDTFGGVVEKYAPKATTYKAKSEWLEPWLNKFAWVAKMDNVLDIFKTASEVMVKSKDKVDAAVAETKMIGEQLESAVKENDLLAVEKLKEEFRQKNDALVSMKSDLEVKSTRVRDIIRNHDIKKYINRINKYIKPYIDHYNAKGELLYREENPIPDMITAWKKKDGWGEYLENLYKKEMGEGYNETTASRGAYTGVRWHLVHDENIDMFSKSSSKERSVVSKSASSSVYSDKFSNMALGTGKYSSGFRTSIESVMKSRYDNVSKIFLFEAMEKEGVFIRKEEGVKTPEKVLGDKPHEFEYDTPVIQRDVDAHGNVKHNTVYKKVSGWVPDKMHAELEAVLNLSDKVKLKEWSPGFVLTWVQVTQFADAVTHSNNLLKQAARLQGMSDTMAGDLVRRIPYVGKIDAIRRIQAVYKEVKDGSIQMDKDTAELAKYSLLRSGAHIHDQMQKIVKAIKIPMLHSIAEKVDQALGVLTPWLLKFDTATRVLMLRTFKDMKEKGMIHGTDIEMRHFIEQVGQYNDRLMGPVSRLMRNYALSPFIVAGRTMNRNSIWAATGYSGVPGKTKEAEIQMRTVNLAAPFMAATIPMIVNYYLWGNVFGPDKNFPIGTVVLSEPDENGQRMKLNVFRDSHFARFLSLTGMGEVAQGLVEGKDPEQYLENAKTTALSTVSHPFYGPMLSTAYKAYSGKDLLTGKQTAYKAPEGGLAQTKENIKGAFRELNPLFFSVGEQDKNVKQGMIAKALSKSPVGDMSHVGHILDTAIKSGKSAMGITFSEKGTNASETLARNFAFSKLGEMTEEGKEQAVFRREMINKLRSDFDATDEELSELVDGGSIPQSLVKKLEHKSETDRILVWLSGNTIEQTIKVYNKLDDLETKQEVADMLNRKLQHARKSRTRSYDSLERLEEEVDFINDQLF